MKLFRYTTRKEKLEAVREDPYEIQYISNPSKEIQLAAVRKNGNAIQFIHNPSKEVQLAAVKKDGSAIQYIHNPSEKVIRYILDKWYYAQEIIQALFAKIGEEGYDKLSDNDKLRLELLKWNQ